MSIRGPQSERHRQRETEGQEERRTGVPAFALRPLQHVVAVLGPRGYRAAEVAVVDQEDLRHVLVDGLGPHLRVHHVLDLYKGHLDLKVDVKITLYQSILKESLH